MAYVIGIDAGGTKTVGLLADETGNVLSKTISGSANLVMKGELEVEKVLFEVIESLEAPEPLGALCLGIAGVGQPGADQVIREVLRRLGQRQPVRVVNDALVALGLTSALCALALLALAALLVDDVRAADAGEG